MAEQLTDSLTVGGWSAERAEGRLRRGSEVRPVEPKVMDLLFLLASAPGRVFSREDLFGHLWPDVIVGEDSLARCVSKLRKSLGDDPTSPRFVETIAKRGYRMIAEVGDPRAVAIPARARAEWSRPFMFAGAVLLLTMLAFAAGWFVASLPGVYPARTAAERAQEFEARRLAELDRAEVASRAR